MEQLYVFLIKNDVWIWFLCGLGLLWYLIQFISRQRELRRSSFHLERERAANDRNAAIFFILVFIGLIGAVYYINETIAPTLPAELFDPPTPEPNVLATQLATTPIAQVTPRAEFPTGTPVIAPTATLRDPSSLPVSADSGDATPTPELVIEAINDGCNDDIAINEPATGSSVSGGMSIFGRATAINFNYYKIEISGPSTNDEWQSLLDGVVNAPVEDGFLGSASLVGWFKGVYDMRLTIIDNNSIEVGSCTIQIGVNN